MPAHTYFDLDSIGALLKSKSKSLEQFKSLESTVQSIFWFSVYSKTQNNITDLGGCGSRTGVG
jgi:hypothetical protein